MSLPSLILNARSDIWHSYLRVIRRLILTYTLEPAGSHGVWGLDDHSFLPYIFGSAQYCPAIEDEGDMPVEGSLPDSPSPGDVAKKNVVDRERTHNMYFAAIGFINDVKTGPFWEHSPILFDISGVRSGWGKINKVRRRMGRSQSIILITTQGMIKMYNAEVLSKFPVVQHFPFGSLFSWEQDANAPLPTQSAHTMSQPAGTSRSAGASIAGPPAPHGTSAPWASLQHGTTMAPTAAPWANAPPEPPQAGMPPTRAPWSGGISGQAPLRDVSQP
jgi:serine/threonine-protein phosphatase 2A activator